MKKVLFGLLAAICIGFVSCEADEAATTPEAKSIILNEGVTNRPSNEPEQPPTPDGKRPVTLAYWYCGNPFIGYHAWTNGVCTYTQTTVDPGTPGSYMMLDHNNHTAYWVTTQWVSGPCVNN